MSGGLGKISSHFVTLTLLDVIQRLSWWTFRIFFIFSARGRGRGRRGDRERGVQFFIESPRGAGGLPRGERGGRGAGRVSAENLGGRGPNIFFRAEMPAKLLNVIRRYLVSLTHY